MPKRTYKPSNQKRRSEHGFRARKADAPHILTNRRQKGRSVLAVTTKKAK